MAKQGGGGALLVVGLVFAVLVLFAGGGMAYKANEELKEKVKKTKSAKKDLSKKQGKLKKDYLDKLQEIRRVVNGDEGPVTKNLYKTTLIAEASKVMKDVTGDAWVKSSDIDLLGQNPRQEWQNLKARASEDSGFEYRDLKSIHEDLTNGLKCLIYLLPKLRTERVKYIEKLQADVTRFEKDRANFKRELKDLQDNYENEVKKVEADRDRFNVQKERLANDVKRANKEKNDFEKEKKAIVDTLLAQKGTLEKRIDQIRRKSTANRNTSDADAEVIYSNPEQGFAWINIGKNQNLRPGMVFHVYRFIKNGRRKLKGKIVINSIEADMAKATIVENAEMTDPFTRKTKVLPLKNDPIIKGDFIQNALFDPNEQQHFVFLGTRVTNKIYKRNELKRKIEEAGGKVEKKISINTDYVILLEGAEDKFAAELEKATQFGVRFMKETDLLEFLRR